MARYAATTMLASILHSHMPSESRRFLSVRALSGPHVVRQCPLGPAGPFLALLESGRSGLAGRAERGRTTAEAPPRTIPRMVREWSANGPRMVRVDPC